VGARVFVGGSCRLKNAILLTVIATSTQPLGTVQRVGLGLAEMEARSSRAYSQRVIAVASGVTREVGAGER
jgi:hypothetical protein